MERDDGPSALDAFRVNDEERFSIERDACNALSDAIKLHCQGSPIPEEVARFCRTEAVMLDADLARCSAAGVSKLPPLSLPGEGYRTLGAKELIERGDEVFIGAQWERCTFIGFAAGIDGKIRRKK